MCATKSEGNLLGEGSGKINGTTNGCKARETLDNIETSVVGNLEGSSDRLEVVGSNVGQLLVGDEGKRLSDGSELGEGEVGEGVVDEAGGAFDLLELGERGGRSITDGDVVGPDKVGERHIDTLAAGLAVGLDNQEIGNVGKSNINSLEVLVVVDIEPLAGVQVDASEGAEVRVGDEHGVGLADLLGEVEGGQDRESCPGDVTNVDQAGERQLGQDGEALEGE